MGWDGRGREAKEGRRRRGRGRQAGRRGSPFNILIVLLTQWNEISWRNARAITQNHSSVRHAVRPPHVRPSVRPLPRLRFRSPGERRRRLRRRVGQSSLPAMPVRCLSSNRPPARRGPLNEQSAPSSRVKRMRRTVNGECTRKRPLSFLGAPMGRSSV